MNKDIMRSADFTDQVKIVEEGKCPFCLKSISDSSFRNSISLQEFKISGLCQACQDEMFGED